MPKHGDLQVWHIPQVPGKPLEISVESLVEARLLLDALARYDAFQFDNRIKPDYSNAQGLMEYDEDEGLWFDWSDSSGNDIDDYSMEELRVLAASQPGQV